LLISKLLIVFGSIFFISSHKYFNEVVEEI
jgi:hypothetical protein